ncbi:Gfo/Idh/MocA family protein [Sinorhizobium meliloti]|uniref:Gfo/Idh/MocA family protein n=1 Tax=Rhizobium meliloti TaxID=382 RepID=UPI000FD8CF43|nr:Gfo/Idh/MocA family oxidoreductase [Sinorhizobium meliloti]MDW9378360.1 gfo/Idh/MocA family oxidoreductase [Sinorhizobium meliloti]MDW9496497.1 gfo/Idh/MocA family oxidoreductase [Sinorhizobium meliloti]MDW9565123.1 gfo/Idh/MocA family oxidoreductase [Sinorhizobium meliloti]MDW9652577.1 gfo/Idh/MocA family oxidoreductase [Sinorhizobium meliloti]MDW9862954.1 gfo/Idh/MocA family oxidoreductase [Sinorhizobium meliloti]
MTRFRLGLVGAGRMGQVHVRAAAESSLVEIAAVADPIAASRLNLAGNGIKTYETAGDMIEAGEVDGVLIATPSNTHVDTVADIGARGLPILCEKPCGVTAEEARKAADVAERYKVHLQIGYWRRFVPELKQLRDDIRAGLLGNLYLVSCFQWDEAPPANSFRATGGGAFIDMGVHEFDQMRWLTGQEPTNFRVATSKTTFAGAVKGDPDAVQLLCDLSDGSSGLVSLGRRFPPGDACWTQVFGTSGFAEARFFWPPDGEAVFLNALQAQLEDFVQAARGGAPRGATASDAVAALTIAEAATELLSRDLNKAEGNNVR